MENAPFLADVAAAPEGAETHWMTTADGVRIRAASWPVPTAAKGTVLLFPGRTEYVEKYGPSAGEYLARGFAFATVDWRGQGLADRACPDPRLGHVDDYDEYQRDVDAFLAFAEAKALPKPWFLVGHSMGGCIGLRTLHRGLGFSGAAFSAPMWGLEIAPHLWPVAWATASIGPLVGLGKAKTPGTDIETYVIAEPFADNQLTTDPDRYAWLKAHLVAHPDLALGGPTLAWLRASLTETRALAGLPAPSQPALTFLGTHERIVNPAAVHAQMDKWSNGSLTLIDAAEHEIMMEKTDTRTRFYDDSAALFAAQG